MRKPLIGIPCCTRKTRDTPRHFVQEEYIAAIHDVALGLPVLLPAYGDNVNVLDTIRSLEGLLLTGSPSNVAPERYGAIARDPELHRDLPRDHHNLAWIHAALAAKVPVFGICRGFQELNVALGGTLHQAVHDVEGKMDHRACDEDPLDVQYAPRHSVDIVPGLLSELLGGVSTIEVNSLHGQGICDLAPGLVVEARAPDGLIEAVRVRDSTVFALAVQWHPEWFAKTCSHSNALFKAFGAAARQHAENRP